MTSVFQYLGRNQQEYYIQTAILVLIDQFILEKSCLRIRKAGTILLENIVGIGMSLLN